MTQSKHTAGPWKAVTEGQGSWTIYPVDGPRDGIVTSFGHYRNRENKEADARLIAAAPELYEVCKRAVEMVNNNPNHPMTGTEILMRQIIERIEQ